MYHNLGYAYAAAARFSEIISKMTRAEALKPGVALSLIGTHIGIGDFPTAKFALTVPDKAPEIIFMTRPDIDFVLQNATGLSDSSKAALEDSKGAIIELIQKIQEDQRKAYEASLIGRTCNWLSRHI